MTAFELKMAADDVEASKRSEESRTGLVGRSIVQEDMEQMIIPCEIV